MVVSLYTKDVGNVCFGVAYENEKIFATTFASDERKALQNLLKNIPFNIPFQHSKAPSVFASQVIESLKKVYDGLGVAQSFSLYMNDMSNYAKRVIETVSKVPLGYVTFYGTVAKVAGGSARAVGRVMGLNPFPLIVPCHRVVCSNLTLGGYGGGLKVKLEILKREARGYSSKKEIVLAGEKLQLFPVEFLLSKLKNSRVQA